MAGPGKPFEKGQTGNPAGRPKGSRNRATAALEAILDGDAETILRRVMEAAQEGDPTAMRLCVDRLIPPKRDRHINFSLPPIETTADVVKATGAMLKAVADGEITPSEAAELSKLVAAHVSAVQAHDLDERLKRIEEASGRNVF